MLRLKRLIIRVLQYSFLYLQSTCEFQKNFGIFWSIIPSWEKKKKKKNLKKEACNDGHQCAFHLSGVNEEIFLEENY